MTVLLEKRYHHRSRFDKARFNKYLTELHNQEILTIEKDQIVGKLEVYEEIKKNRKIQPWILSLLI